MSSLWDPKFSEKNQVKKTDHFKLKLLLKRVDFGPISTRSTFGGFLRYPRGVKSGWRFPKEEAFCYFTSAFKTVAGVLAIRMNTKMES